MDPLAWLQGITAAVGILATIVGLLFAVLAFISWNEIKDVNKRMREETSRLERRFDAMLKASQKLMAGYEEALKKNYDTAIELYTEARDIYPGLYNVHNALGWAYLSKGNTHAAIEAFRTAKEKRPEDIEPYSDLAYAFFQANEIPAALREVKQSIEKDPGVAEYYKTDLFKPYRDNPEFRKLVGIPG